MNIKGRSISKQKKKLQIFLNFYQINLLVLKIKSLVESLETKQK